jgi:hypothetical protein
MAEQHQRSAEPDALPLALAIRGPLSPRQGKTRIAVPPISPTLPIFRGTKDKAAATDLCEAIDLQS